MGSQMNGVGGALIRGSGEAIEIVAWRIALQNQFEPGWTGTLTLAVGIAIAMHSDVLTAIFASCRGMTFNGNVLIAAEAHRDASDGWIPFLGIGPLIPEFPFLTSDRTSSNRND